MIKNELYILTKSLTDKYTEHFIPLEEMIEKIVKEYLSFFFKFNSIIKHYNYFFGLPKFTYSSTKQISANFANPLTSSILKYGNK